MQGLSKSPLTTKSGGVTACRMHISFDEKTRALLERCTDAGSKLAGHRLSFSTTIRRALMLLEERQDNIKTVNQKATEVVQLSSAMLR